MHISANDKKTLRELGRQIHDIAADPVNATRQALWRKNNALQRARPPVFIFEIPWHEMEYNGELALTVAGDKFLQGLECRLRQTIYQWRHLPGDMVVEDYIACPPVIHNTGFGIREEKLHKQRNTLMTNCLLLF